MTFAYNSDGTTTQTDPLGAVRIFGFQKVGNHMKSTSIAGTPCPECGYEKVTTYDANGFVSSVTDYNDRTTTYTHDARGLETSRTEASGTPQARTITTTWHASYRVPLQISEPGRTTAFTYDQLTKTVTDTATSTSRTWSWTYGNYGRVLTEDGPRTDVQDVTTYTYNDCTTGGGCGQLHTITNALGHVTTFNTHDGNGRPLTITDPNGMVTTLTYSPRGWLTSRTVDGKTTGYDYDGAGQLKKVTLPDGAFVAYSYDAAHRLTDIADAEGNRIHYTLDAMGHRTQQDVLDPQGVLKARQNQVYDTLGRLQQTLGQHAQRTRYTYDAQGNRTSVTLDGEWSNDPKTTTSIYDALDRLVSLTDPENGQTQYQYNALDQLTSVTDPKGLTTSYAVNAFGEVTQQLSPDTGTTGYQYDAAGNLLQSLNARGITVTYSYDALNRPTVAYDGNGGYQAIFYSYDGSNYTQSAANAVGRLTGVKDQTGEREYRYDARGNLIETRTRFKWLGMADQVTSYSYDAADRLVSMSYPSGRVVSYTRDALGRITAVQSTKDSQTTALATGVGYTAFGAPKQWSQGSLATTASYDLSQRLTSLDSGVLGRTYRFYDTDLIQGVLDSQDASNDRSYWYDRLGRLAYAGGPWGDQNFSFDANGNRLYFHNFTSTPQEHVSYGYDTSNAHQRLLGIQSANDTTAYSHDEIGSVDGIVTQTGNGGGGSGTTIKQAGLGYDALNRLFLYNKEIAPANDPTVNGPVDPIDQPAPSSYRYLHNAEGLRTRKDRVDPQDPYGTAQATRLYLYDQQQQLIAELDPGTGAIVSETVWMEHQPIAHYTRPTSAPVIEQGNTLNPANGLKLYHVHNDHLGTPQVLTDAANDQIAWKAIYDPYGKTIRVTGNGPNNTASIVFNHRQPGQYFDSESGLYYNHHRDFDPGTGRYLQSDPIGLVAGVNTYAYVGGNPVSFTDPEGLRGTIYRGTGDMAGQIWLGNQMRNGAIQNYDSLERRTDRYYGPQLRMTCLVSSCSVPQPANECSASNPSGAATQQTSGPVMSAPGQSGCVCMQSGLALTGQ